MLKEMPLLFLFPQSRRNSQVPHKNVREARKCFKKLLSEGKYQAAVDRLQTRPTEENYVLLLQAFMFVCYDRTLDIRECGICDIVAALLKSEPFRRSPDLLALVFVSETCTFLPIPRSEMLEVLVNSELLDVRQLMLYLNQLEMDRHLCDLLSGISVLRYARRTGIVCPALIFEESELCKMFSLLILAGARTDFSECTVLIALEDSQSSLTVCLLFTCSVSKDLYDEAVLLYETGGVSSSEIFFATEYVLRSQRPHTRMVDFLCSVARQPRSLLSLSSLTVSRLVGCTCDRASRVRALGLPSPLADLVRLKTHTDVYDAAIAAKLPTSIRRRAFWRKDEQVAGDG